MEVREKRGETRPTGHTDCESESEWTLLFYSNKLLFKTKTTRYSLFKLFISSFNKHYSKLFDYNSEVG